MVVESVKSRVSAGAKKRKATFDSATNYVKVAVDKTSNSQSFSDANTTQRSRNTMASLSFSLGGSSSRSTQKRSPPPAKRTNGTKRDHAALLDDASDDEDTSHAKRQTITHFDTAAGGALDARAPKKEEKKPLVITALANRDWREASKKQRAQKYGITTDQLDARKEDGQNAEGADKVVKETEAVKYGLNVFAPTASASADDTNPEEEVQQQEEKPEDKTADQLAIDALTGAAPTSTLTIPTSAVTEEDAFNDSYHTAPPAPSLSDYAAVPVEEYGAAMLRGMGWKGPSTTNPSAPTKNGKKALPPAKRPALLGIGADPNAAAQAEELGAWGKTSTRGGRKEPTMFIPVSMKNKKTGETLTEEELKEKLRRDKEEAENQRFLVSNDLEIRDRKRDSKRYDDQGGRTERRKKDDHYHYSSGEEEERRRRRRRKDRERNHDRHEHKPKDRDRESSRRDRSRDRDDRRDRSRSRSRSRDHSKPSSRRDRSRDRRDRDYENPSTGRRESHRHEDEHKSSSRRDRDRERDYHRSSRR